MSATQKNGYYSVIQLCPDRSRMEALNVGVVLLIPPSVMLWRIAVEHPRIKAIWPEQDLLFLQQSLMSLAKRLSTIQGIDALDQFIATRANSLIMTPTRGVAVHESLENLIGRLFKTLIQ